MQTPGRQTQPQTPMISVGRRMEGSLDRMLQRATEGAKDIERPRVLSLGKVISQLDTIGNSMKEMRNQIRSDIKVKQQYYGEESKILKKDSENLESISSKLLRRGLGGVSAGIAVSQFREGDVRGGLTSAALASIFLAPEILEVISGGVVQSLALKGLLGGGRGATTAGIGQNLGGASRLKNPLLITAALAASLLLPSFARGQQNSDQKRQELTRRTIGGQDIINRNDVNRFRVQLSRFENILDNINREQGKKVKQSTIPTPQPELGAPKEGLPRELTKNQALDFLDVFRNKNERKEGKNQWWDFFDVFRNPTRKDGENVDELEKEVDKENNLISLEIDNSKKENNKIETNTDIAANFVTENQNFFGDQISQTVESNIDLADIIAKLDIDQLKTDVNSSGSTEQNTNVVSLGGNNQDTPQSSSGFSGNTATPTSVFVSTKFDSSGGAIDKFESASSLRTYGAFS